MNPEPCPVCGTPLPSDAPEGLCPRCSFGGALEVRSGGRGQEARVSGQDRDQRSEASGQRADGRDQARTAPSTLDPGAARLPKRFGDYELLEEIAHGGMGVVYKARQVSLNRTVAVKLIRAGPYASKEYVHRFRMEASAAAVLQHPNIVAVHEVGVHEEQHYFSMDYVAGQSLAQIVREGPLAPNRAARYVQQIAEAIQYAHAAGILHRDLKPSNVLIDAQDQPRITDFGLAKQLHSDSAVTLTGEVIGTPGYMPPEQASGRRGAVQAWSDVYSLGAILYHLLTGRAPFAAGSLEETLNQVLHRDPVSVRLLNPAVPRDLDTICLKCLEKEPAKRYATAQLLADELGRFLNQKPILARPLHTAGRAWRWCRRNPRLAWAMGVALLSLVMGLAGVSWQWRLVESQRQRAELGELLARRNAYAADMKEVQRALDDSDLGRARALLGLHRPQQSQIANRKSQIQTDLRGWEWRYLWARCQSEERFTLHQYSNAVSAVAFSPDGKRLAVRRQYSVALWDAVAQRPMGELPAHGHGQRYGRALAFSPRGNLLAWGYTNANGTYVVRLRDVSTQQDMAPLPHSERVVSLAFSPNAKAMATLAYDGTVRVWDLESQQVVTQFATARVDTAPGAFSGRPRATVTSGADATRGPQELETQPAPMYLTASAVLTDRYGCVLFSPDGRWLAVGEARPQIRLLERATGKETVIRVPAPADGITALAFSPDSGWLAAGCGAGTNDIPVWDLATGKPAVWLAGHGGWVAALAFSPDGHTLASASSDQTVRLWDLSRQAETRPLQGNLDEVWALAWSPDGQHLVTGARDGSVRYWDPTPKRAALFRVLEHVQFWGPTFLPDSQTFLTATRPEGAVVRWDAESLQAVERLSFLGTNHTSLDLSPDGRWLGLGDTAGNVQVWDFPGRRMVTNLVFPDANIFALWFSPRGNLLMCGAIPSGPGMAGKLYVGKLWAVPGWNDVSLPAFTEKNVFDGNFSPDERTIAIGYGNGTAAWWDLRTRQRTVFFDCGYVSSVHAVFSPDGRHFATGGTEDGLMTLWDVATTDKPRPVGRAFRNALHDLLFSPDSRRLLASGTSPREVVKVWDVETARDVATLPGVPGWYVHMGFSPDSNTLFAASIEGTALFWNAPSFDQIARQESQQAGAK